MKIFTRKPTLVLVLCLLLLALSVPAALAQGNVLTDPPKTFTLTQGWYEGRQTFYYDFGANTRATDDGQNVVTAPIYVLVTGFDAQGNPQMVPGQHNIVDVIPGDPGYSDLWKVTFVTVPQDYIANTIKSADELRAAGYTMTETDVLVNCPIVPRDSTLADGGAPLVQGWYKGQEVYYFDFGPNSAKTAPIYAFITGFDADGNPQFVEGQANVIGVIPGDPEYSAFWSVNLVTVPAGYQPNSITSVEQVMASGYPITQPGLLVNCPVIRTEEAMEAMGPPAMLPTTGGEQSGSGPALWSIAAGVAAVAAGLFGGFRLSRKRRQH